MENGQETCKIGRKERLITPPVSYATLRDIVASGNTNMARAMYAALGQCVQMNPTLDIIYTGNVLRYGGLVMDEMHSRGADINVLDEAALKCWQACLHTYIPDAEVDAKVDFTDPVEDPETPKPSTSGSPT